MNISLQKRNYRGAFITAVALNAALLLALGGLWWRSQPRSEPSQPRTGDGGVTTQGVANAPQAAEAAPPGPVQLSAQRLQSIGVKFGGAEMKSVTAEIRAAGNVEIDERRVSYVQVRFPGWIRTIYANATYQYVHKGQPLFTIYSPDLVTTEQEYLLARRNQQQLQKSSVEGVAPGADALVSAARERLAQWEVPAGELAKLESTGKAITDLTFNSPVTGYITEKNVVPNMYVQPDTKLYVVADLSTVWVQAQVFQNDLGKIKAGDPAQVTVDAYPGKIFSGRVHQVLPQVDPATRTIRVRLALPNPGLKLTPGMYVNVLLKSPLGKQLVVPASAVFHSGTRQMVFVNRGEGNLEPREVETGAQVGSEVIITRGLRAGDSVVTSAGFLIDSESQLQAASGAFVPPPPGAGAAAAMNQTAPAEAHIELTTKPDPPHKGSNVIRVRLTDAGGSPIAGAQVSIFLYMPAMPAMGMAAIKTSLTLADRGGGVYEDNAELGSGGTWQVTITAQQNGRQIASKRLNLAAEGGM